MKDLRKARIVKDIQGVKFYKKGLIGMSTEINKVGNVMFYPKDESPCYRVCLEADCIEFLE